MHSYHNQRKQCKTQELTSNLASITTQLSATFMDILYRFSSHFGALWNNGISGLIMLALGHMSQILEPVVSGQVSEAEVHTYMLCTPITAKSH
jgi:hypothetical protein